MVQAAKDIFSVGSTPSVLMIFSRIGRSDRRWLLDVFRGRLELAQDAPPRRIQLQGAHPPQSIEVRTTYSDEHCQSGCWIVAFRDVSREQAELQSINQRAEHLRHPVEMNPHLPSCGPAPGTLIAATDPWLSP